MKDKKTVVYDRGSKAARLEWEMTKIRYYLEKWEERERLAVTQAMIDKALQRYEETTKGGTHAL